MAKAEDGKIITMPCLGRPLALGMLYDCRNDTVVPKLTLWDNVMLRTALDSKPPQAGSRTVIIADDSLETKATNLDIGASLKLSCLSGLIKVEGSAKYLNDHTSSMYQCRVCLKYSSTSRFDQLNMDRLQKVQYPSVFEKKVATHVVIGVQYGAEAFFVFDRNIKEGEDKLEVKATMESLVKKIPDAKVRLNDLGRKEVDKYECRLHGDLRLPSSPTTFDSAVKIYHELPELLKEGDSPRFVPKIVLLCPLTRLNRNTAMVVHEVSLNLVSEAQKVMEDILELERRANDLLNTSVCSFFSAIQLQLSNFKEIMIKYKMNFSQKLMHLMPQIREGGEEESTLAELFQSKEASPFSSHTLSTWIQAKEKENEILEKFLYNMQAIKSIEFTLTPYDLGVILKDLDIDCVVCFSFKVTASSDALLDQMEAYLQHEDIKPKGIHTNLWFRNKQLVASLTNKVEQFTSYVKANEGSEKTRFVVADGGEMKDDSVAEILRYNNGVPEPFSPPFNHRELSAPKREISVKLEPTSGTDSVKSDASNGQWGTNQFKGNEVEMSKMRTKSDTGVSNTTRVKTPYVKSRVTEFEAKHTRNKTSSGLQTHIESNVKAKHGAGGSHRDTFRSGKTLRESILSAPWGVKICKECITHRSVKLQWYKPSLGADSVKHYTISYKLKSSTPNIKWGAKETSGNETTLTVKDLQAKKEYQFRVRAECDDGVSKYSDNVTATTSSVPPPPRRVKVRDNGITDCSVELEWTEPELSLIHI